MYRGEPTIIPVPVSRSSPAPCVISDATPKSVSSARPLSASSSTFSGLMSRWMTPCSCAYARALASSDRIAMARAPSAGCSRSIHSLRLSPGTNSITKYRLPAASPAACTATMLGCRSFATVRASFRKRSRNARVAASSGVMTLIATRRSSVVSRARNTVPIAPAPSARSTSYCPANAERRAASSADVAAASGMEDKIVPRAGARATACDNPAR